MTTPMTNGVIRRVTLAIGSLVVSSRTKPPYVDGSQRMELAAG
jgi:hypothetical protein